MAYRTFKECIADLEAKAKVYNDCGKHDFEDKPCGFTAVGRFGGHCVNIYKCKKCGFEACRDDEYAKAISHYDSGGRPL